MEPDCKRGKCSLTVIGVGEREGKCRGGLGKVKEERLRENREGEKRSDGKIRGDWKVCIKRRGLEKVKRE